MGWDSAGVAAAVSATSTAVCTVERLQSRTSSNGWRITSRSASPSSDATSGSSGSVPLPSPLPLPSPWQTTAAASPKGLPAAQRRDLPFYGGATKVSVGGIYVVHFGQEGLGGSDLTATVSVSPWPQP